MTTFRINPGAVWRESGGELIGLDGSLRNYVAANASGTLLWRRLVGGAEREELVQALLDAYEGLDRERAGRDVDAFLAALSAGGLLES